MREHELVKKTTMEYDLTLITCNRCGKTQKLKSYDVRKEWQAAEYQSFSCSFKYGSKFDMEDWEFDLCEDCLEEIVKSFKIKPERFEV